MASRRAANTAVRGLLWASAPMLSSAFTAAGLKEEKPATEANEPPLSSRRSHASAAPEVVLTSPQNGKKHACTKEGKFVRGCDELKIFSGRSHPGLAAEVAGLLGTEVSKAEVNCFMDGETRIQLMDSVRGHDVYVIQSCIAPVNDRIIELLLFIATMNRASAKSVTAVIPYFAYKHHRREYAVSNDKRSRYLGSPAQDLAKMLTVVGTDRVIAVDLQRPGHDTESTFFDMPVQNCITDRLGIAHYAAHPDLARGGKVTVVAPNPAVVKKAQIFRKGLNEAWKDSDRGRVGFALFSRAPVVKDTYIHQEAELLGDVEGADVIIVDDIVDTANTLVRVGQVLKSRGAKNVYVYASHGIFTSDALFKIESTPEISKVVVTNTIPLPPTYTGQKQLSIGPLLAKLIEASHFRKHLYNEEAPVLDPEST